MPRIRALKPELWSSPGNRGLEPLARLLFMAMWNWADDTGRGSAVPGELLGFAFPHDEDLTAKDIRRMLGGIRRAFGVEFYEVGGRPYFFIPTWEKHQKIDKRSGAKHPAPEEGTPYNPDPEDTDCQQEHHDSTDTRRVPSSPRGSLGAGTEEQRNRGTGKDSSSPASPPRDSAPPNNADPFDDDSGEIPGLPPVSASVRKPEPGSDDDPEWVKFWSVFPNSAGKADARKAWAGAVKKVAPFVIIAAAEKYRELVTREGREKKHIKHASGWLNGERWNDEITLPSQPANAPPQDRAARRSGANVHHEHNAGSEIGRGLTG
jgi:hypothetical protein